MIPLLKRLQVIAEIASGWKNYAWPSAKVEALAKARAKQCAACDEAVTGKVATMIGDEIKDIEGLVCRKCDCPLSAKTRSVESKCELGKWQPKA